MILLATAGRIEGGWEFVIAAYAVTWVMLAGYTWSLWRRSRAREEE